MFLNIVPGAELAKNRRVRKPLSTINHSLSVVVFRQRRNMSKQEIYHGGYWEKNETWCGKKFDDLADTDEVWTHARELINCEECQKKANNES